MTTMDIKSPIAVGEGEDIGWWFDREGGRYLLNLVTVQDPQLRRFGLRLRADDPDDDRRACDILLVLHEGWQYDQFRPVGDDGSDGVLRPYRLAEVKRTFVGSCKQAIFYRELGEPGRVVVDLVEDRANPLSLRWRADSGTGERTTNPFTYDRRSEYEEAQLACAEWLVLRRLSGGEPGGLSVEEISESTGIPGDLAHRVASSMHEGGYVRVESSRAPDGMGHLYITDQGRYRLAEVEAIRKRPKRIGF